MSKHRTQRERVSVKLRGGVAKRLFGPKISFIGCFFSDDDESDEESVKKTNKCSLVWEVSRGCSSIWGGLRLGGEKMMKWEKLRFKALDWMQTCRSDSFRSVSRSRRVSHIQCSLSHASAWESVYSRVP